jgi:hypothetical protein
VRAIGARGGGPLWPYERAELEDSELSLLLDELPARGRFAELFDLPAGLRPGAQCSTNRV